MPRATPPEAELAEARDAFARGDYASVRRGADAILAADAPAEVRAEAQDLRRRTGIDPVQLAVLGLCLLLFLWIVFTYVAR